MEGLEARDSTPAVALTLRDVYHQLMELDSIERALRDQIISVEIQSRKIESVALTRDAESPWPASDNWPRDSFDKIVHELEQARCKVASLHDSMREVANASSRSRIRPLNILDLPDELLRTIFEQCIKPWTPSEGYFYIPHRGKWDRIEDIKNLRLTCRRFYLTSSHLLLRHVDVAMYPSSLAHLEEIACHPLISKGVRAVRVHFNYFSAHLATDMFHFTALAIMELEDVLHFYKIKLQSGLGAYDIPFEKLGPIIQKAELILEKWLEFLNVLSNPDGDPDIIKEETAKSREVAGLVGAHEIYRRHYLAQESVLKDGAFIQAIATAMSKMPTAKRLFVGDSFNDFESGKYESIKPFVYAVEDPKDLATRYTVMPLDWDDARSKRLDDQPKEALLQLLLTIFDNNIPINYLCMNISPATNLSIPATQEQLQQLAAGTEQLRVFEFQGVSPLDSGPTVNHDSEQIASFGSFISACMGGKALALLDVDPRFTLDKFAPVPPVSIGSLLVSRHCPDIKKLRLSYCPLHLSELKTFLGGLNGPLRIYLEDVLLLSGTWAEALDLIRHKANQASAVTGPWGAECDDMSEEEILAMFGSNTVPCPGKESKATRYIRGYTKDNPLRTREGNPAT